ncbi:MAG: hypothetical protein PUH67_03490 [bacterium]|nr:hypothetical protein [bacterium]
MKKEEKIFISKIKKSDYVFADKREIATKLAYYAYKKQNNKLVKDDDYNLSSITSKDSYLQEAYDALAYSYNVSKKDFKELNLKIIDEFPCEYSINNEVYDLVIKLLELKESDYLAQINAIDSTFILKGSLKANDDINKLSSLCIPDNEYTENIINMSFILSDSKTTIIDALETMLKFKPNKVFINPCYKLLDKNYRYSTVKNEFWDDLLKISNAMTSKSKVVALVPNSLLSSRDSEEKRANLIKHGYLEGIISLPLRYYSKDLQIETSLLVLSKNNSSIKIVDIKKVLSTEDIKAAEMSSITDYIYEFYNENSIQIQFDEILNKNSNLLISNIITDETYKNLENLVTLSSIAKVTKSSKKTSVDYGHSIDQNNESPYCLLTASDIEDGIIDYEHLVRIIYEYGIEAKTIKNGDVVITNKSSIPKVAVIECDDKKVVPTGSMIVISPNEKQLDGYYLKKILDSNKGKKILETTRKGQRTNIMDPVDIEKLKIPYVSYDDQLKVAKEYKMKLDELHRKKQETAKLIEEINNYLNKGE